MTNNITDTSAIEPASIQSFISATLTAADTCLDGDNQMGLIRDLIDALARKIPADVDVITLASEVFSSLPTEDPGFDATSLNLLKFGYAESSVDYLKMR